MLFRLFPHDPAASPEDPGGALHVPRALQGPGRHDAPDLYGALYLSRDPISVVAELLRRYQRQVLEAPDLLWGPGLPYALASLDDSRLRGLIDLDDPAILLERALRPSQVATGRRRVTQRWARALHDAGAAGFEWWSAIEASWINVTLFAERALPGLSEAAPPEPLTLSHHAVVEAAGLVGVTLAVEQRRAGAG